MSLDLNALTSGVTGAMDTSFPTCPPGEYPAQVKSFEGKNVETQDGTKTIVEITWSVQDEEVKKVLGLSEPTVRQSLWLDIGADGKIDAGEGKNIRLGRLREALGLNDPSKEFSFDDLAGQVGIITVTNTTAKDDPDTIYANVAKVVGM